MRNGQRKDYPNRQSNPVSKKLPQVIVKITSTSRIPQKKNCYKNKKHPGCPGCFNYLRFFLGLFTNSFSLKHH